MRVEPQQLKAFMLDAGLIKEIQFNEALERAEKQDKRVEEILVNEGIIKQDDLIKLKAYILGIPYVALEEEIVDPEILKIIPEPIAKTHNIVSFRKKGNNLEVAMLDPEDLQTIEFIKKKADLRILPRLPTTKALKMFFLNIKKVCKKSLAKL